jgi:hypothetical protein
MLGLRLDAASSVHHLYGGLHLLGNRRLQSRRRGPLSPVPRAPLQRSVRTPNWSRLC